jgi:hypothetical protein
MTAINLDDQIVATAYDKQTRVCSYTYQHTDGSRYTVSVPLADMEKIGLTPSTKLQRRNHIANRILNHIRTSPPDGAGPAA